MANQILRHNINRRVVLGNKIHAQSTVEQKEYSFTAEQSFIFTTLLSLAMDLHRF
jgi:hypothetical protein